MKRKLKLSTETLRQLASRELERVAGGLPSGALSAENGGNCCSFDVACPPATDGCPTRHTDCGSCGLSCRAC